MSKVSSTQISTVELTLEIYGYVKLAAFAAMCLDGTLKSCYNNLSLKSSEDDFAAWHAACYAMAENVETRFCFAR